MKPWPALTAVPLARFLRQLHTAWCSSSVAAIKFRLLMSLHHCTVGLPSPVTAYDMHWARVDATWSHVTAAFAILLLTTPHAANAAVTCDQVASTLAQCMSYAVTGEGNPTVQCCSDTRSLNWMAAANDEYQAVCNCLKNLAKGTTVNASAAAGLPSKCGVIVPYAISTSTGCSNMKPNAVVAQDGSGHYNTVLAAIENMPLQKGIYVIYVEAGVYNEENITVWQGQNNVFMYGDGYHKTIINGDKSNRTGYKTDKTQLEFAMLGRIKK